MSTEKAALDALTEIEKEVSGTEGRTRGAEDLCAQYKKIKKYLNIALPFIEKIPTYGNKVAVAIRFLMTLADKVCPA